MEVTMHMNVEHENEAQRALWALKEEFICAFQNLKILERQVLHSPGCIVMKGPQKQHAYWQYYSNGVHIFKYIKGKQIEEVRQKIAAYKQLRKRRRMLRADIQCFMAALKAFGEDPWAVLEEYEQERQYQDDIAAQRAVAMRGAQNNMKSR